MPTLNLDIRHTDIKEGKIEQTGKRTNGRQTEINNDTVIMFNQ